MNIFQSIIFGLVEGVTEFLPISSTAHLDITRVILNIPITDFIKSFEIIIQFGAILAVVFLYKEKLLHSLKYIRNILIAFIPTGVIGFLLYKLIKSFLLGNTSLIAWILLIGGVIIILFESKYKNKTSENIRQIEDLTIKELLIMGTAQALAVVPGVSRSLSVIISGRLMGLSKELVTEFSFLLAIPTMLAATVYDLYKSGFAFTSADWGVLSVGFITSFIVALFVVKWLISYIQNHSFSIFGWYRILIGVFILLFLI